MSRKIIGQVARDAGIEPSTLALYFGYYPKKRQTERLQEETLRAVLLALGVDPYEFLRLVSDRQLEFWPAAAGGDAQPLSSEGSDHLRAFASIVRMLPLPMRVRASRAAITAGIGSIAEAGGVVPAETYELLKQLDGIQSEIRQLKQLAS